MQKVHGSRLRRLQVALVASVLVIGAPAASAVASDPLPTESAQQEEASTSSPSGGVMFGVLGGGDWPVGTTFPISELAEYGIGAEAVDAYATSPEDDTADAPTLEVTQPTDAAPGTATTADPGTYDSTDAGYESPIPPSGGQSATPRAVAPAGSTVPQLASIISGWISGCSATTADYSTYDVWLDKMGDVVRLRRGWVNLFTGGGFGLCKLVNKHNLTAAAVRTVTKHYNWREYLYWISPTRYDYHLRAYYIYCSGWWIYRTCKVKDSTDVKVAVDRRTLSDWRQFGIVTAYCPEEGVWACPDYVKNALNTT